MNRNPFSNDRASIPHFSLRRERSDFLSEIEFANDAKLDILHHWQTKSRCFASKLLPSQGKMRERCMIIQKYYWVSISPKLNGFLQSPLRKLFMLFTWPERAANQFYQCYVPESPNGRFAMCFFLREVHHECLLRHHHPYMGLERGDSGLYQH